MPAIDRASDPARAASPGAMPALARRGRRAAVARRAASSARAQQARLAALWGSDETATRRRLRACTSRLRCPAGLRVARAAAAATSIRAIPASPTSIRARTACSARPSTCSACARARTAMPTARRWLRHGAWPGGRVPAAQGLRRRQRAARAGDDRYPFVQVEGDGVHEIPVGPVHAGTIEPGHFRFSIVGEKVLRLEERLGYKHKGIEKRFESMTLEEGARLAGRVSRRLARSPMPGPTPWRSKASTGTQPPARARCAARAAARARAHRQPPRRPGLSRQRRARWRSASSQFWRLKEDVLRAERASCSATAT